MIILQWCKDLNAGEKFKRLRDEYHLKFPKHGITTEHLCFTFSLDTVAIVFCGRLPLETALAITILISKNLDLAQLIRDISCKTNFTQRSSLFSFCVVGLQMLKSGETITICSNGWLNSIVWMQQSKRNGD